MEELPLLIQMKLQALPGREKGLQSVDFLLEDGRLIEGVTVVDCSYVEDDRLEAHLVSDVVLPGQPTRPWRAVLYLILLLLGIAAMFYFIGQIQP